MKDRSIEFIQSSNTGLYDNVAVIGAGAWGTALACVLVRAGRNVTLWARRPELAEEINSTGLNQRYLPDIPLPEGLRAVSDMGEALAGAQAVLIVTPSVSIREITEQAHALAAPEVPLFICAKGVEKGTHLLMSGIAEDAAPGRVIGVISGPTFAVEVAADAPTAVTIASNEPEWDKDIAHHAAARMAQSMGTYSFRPYVSNDMVGVEIGGAVKNVVAIACGILEGAGFGMNARAALITRGLSEIKELAVAMGGTRETVTGLAGMGDLMLTCSSTKSRNFSYGRQRGAGIAHDAVFEGKPVVVEGHGNALTVTDLARALGVFMPICEMTRSILHDDVPIGHAFAEYWAAPLQAEPRALDIEIAHPAAEAAFTHYGSELP
ncbi:NAD(P)-dependent glycerol-3-phosphate dehydrogenase [Paroceanicella profunda]|uniref:Glycerol-3-phosphate dehydrogenase [NAD(P)+] n=1 Tax=Paroceanicella profunda TaxID=2579971 RepID=A0A5B8FHS0_9RHOB|nr:NAD(P)H-dependent glycerol-3-phosphate dehydrogenase [Paroceanicella profunda]QDL92791.1 NAD(P)-dependent glycerol-3-phosphate dehydrogenase [Paroceanicella profunda]